MKSNHRSCAKCGHYQENGSVYYTCIDCFDLRQTTPMFNLCSICFNGGSGTFDHKHRSNFVDNFVLLQKRRSPENTIARDLGSASLKGAGFGVAKGVICEGLREHEQVAQLWHEGSDRIHEGLEGSADYASEVLVNVQEAAPDVGSALVDVLMNFAVSFF